MKAIVYTTYGPPDVLQPKEIEAPVPKENELLIRIHAATVGVGDLMARHFNDITPRKFTMPVVLWLPSLLYFGVKRPRHPVLGSEFAGEVKAVGAKVTRFKKGDEVFGYRGPSFGAYAEYLCMNEEGCVAIKPTAMSYEEAASVPYGAIMAVGLLKHVSIRPGQKVLIIGASGAIGSAALQIAKLRYGAEVTGVCSTPRVDLVRSLGADRVIDYMKEDFTGNGERYDLIIDVMGTSSFARTSGSLNDNGIHLFVSFKMKQLMQTVWTSLTKRRHGGRRVICGIAPGSREDLIAVKALVEAGTIRAFIDRKFPLHQAAEAHRYTEAGQRTGTVVITV